MAGKQSREVIGGGRRCGKTTELIKRASDGNLYILCANRTMARIIFKQAKDMRLDIPHPITLDDLPLSSPYVDKVLVDEVEIVLQGLIGKPIDTYSTSYNMKKPSNLNDVPTPPKKPPVTRKDSRSVGTLTVDLDADDALKGLKAIQREARKASKELREVERLTKNCTSKH